MSDEIHGRPGAYKAADILEKGDGVPLYRRRLPFWGPTPPAAAAEVHVPVWRWEREEGVPEGAELVDLDVNAAYLAAASSVTVAHSELHRDPSPDRLQGRLPGYYLIDPHPWQVRGIPSPLGTAQLPDGPVWVAHPTLRLLLSLAEEGFWPDPVVYEAYTCETGVRLRKWAEKVRDDRAAAIAQRAAAPEGSPAHAAAEQRYQDIKAGYAMAVQMLGTPYDAKGTPSEQRRKRNRAHRPDWMHAIHAQHAANTWRKMWHCLQVGHGPAAAGSVDRVTFLSDDCVGLVALNPCPIRVDQSGVTLGSFKAGQPYVIEDLPDVPEAADVDQAPDNVTELGVSHG